MKTGADFAQMQKGKWIMSELIDRQMAIEALRNTKFRNDLFLDFGYENAINIIESLPSVQPEPSEITDEQAILHLQSTGWMQNHDREIYESGLKEQLADDSESYDSLIPYEDDGDTISRQAAIDAMKYALDPHIVQFVKSKMAIEALPSAQPKYEPVKAEDFAKTMSENTIYSFIAWYGTVLELIEKQGFTICKKTM